MNNLKETIETGKKLLEQYKKILADKKELEQNYDPQKAMMLLLDIHQIKIAERVEVIEKKVADKEKEYMEQFEQFSVECNLKIDGIITQAKQYIGKDPVGVTLQIEELVNKYETQKDDIEQEEKNNIYDQLQGHCRFMKKLKTK